MKNIEEILFKNWGYKTFKPNQKKIINSIIKGKYRGNFDFIVCHKESGDLVTFLECKHTNERTKIKDCINRYLPQMHIYMYLLDVSYGYLSIIRGNNTPEYFKITFDDDYFKSMQELIKYFWQRVDDGEDISTSFYFTEPNPNTVRVNDMLDYDMTDTEWDSLCDRLDQMGGAVEDYEKNKNLLKELVPADAKSATTDNSNWLAIRNKKNVISLRRKEMKL